MDQPTPGDMRDLVKQGKAMPAKGQGRPGRFPIKNRGDLENAIRAVGRAGGAKGTEADRVAVRKFILKRARTLNLMNLIPATWSSDGSLKA